ncbi:alpha/beta fold hydrolase [Chromobacterium amazonense]|uniref:thioesterase II family protein n=1 Tax=Chromobacterium amazonense TaxID=1382803 RepID=UPI00237E1C24|nr:alpha/beta fold hydrolase [Chromobacterium amazonense]MDE1715945.1 alpha/beta fold hydrolase [Chromobacterium amazonense]
MTRSNILLIPTPKPRAQCRLLVFHHACGNASSYYHWASSMPPEIEIALVELPGRGRHIRHAPVASVSAMHDWLNELSDHLPEKYGVFGHSMGALVGYHFAHEMVRRGLPPCWLGISGVDAPHAVCPAARISHQPVHEQSDQEIISYLRTLGGTPFEVLENPQLLEMLLRLARADFGLVHELFEIAARLKVPVPLTVFSGRQDSLQTEQGIKAWALATSSEIRYHSFDGGHFYMQQQTSQILTAITHELKMTMQ